MSVVDVPILATADAPGFWRRLVRQRPSAFVALLFLLALYASLIFVELIAPYAPDTRSNDALFAPPQMIHVFHDGNFVGPYVYGYTASVDLQTYQRTFILDTAKIEKLRFLCVGDPYDHWLFGPSTTHLVCPAEGSTFYFLGTDRLGRDIFSRIVYGARISLTIGLVGVALSFFLGCLLGGLAGYLGGWTDAAVLRVIELLRSLPELPLWLALSAALPATWSPVWVFFGITLILGLLDWPGLARAVRAKVLSLREEDYVTAAELIGASRLRILFRHMLPNFSGHLIASVTLAVPHMILGETALSFLGLGLRPPITSWGVLLNEAQNIGAIELYPWLLAPLIPVVMVVLAFNILGDGLRDAADPYAR